MSALFSVVSLAGLFFSAAATAQVRSTGTAAPPELVLHTGHTTRLAAVAFSGDSKLVASADGADGDGTIKLWEVSTRRQLRTLVGHSAGVTVVAFSSDGRLLASGSEDDTIRVWEVETGREVNKFFVSEGVSFLLFGRNSRYLVSTTFNPYLGRDREPDPELDLCPNVKDKPGFCEGKDVNLWDLQSRRLVIGIDAPPLKNAATSGSDASWHIAFSPDGRVLAVGVDGIEVRLWDVVSGKELPSLSASRPPFVFASSEQHLATTSANGKVVIWDLANRRELTNIAKAGDPVAFTNHDTRLVTTTGKDNREVIRIWDLRDGRQVESLAPDPVLSCPNCFLNFSSDGRWMVRSGWDQPSDQPTLFLWDLASPGTAPRNWEDLEAPIRFSPDGRWLCAATRSRNLWLFDLQAGREFCTQASPLWSVGALAVSSGPSWLAAANGGTIHLWELATGTQTMVLPGHFQKVAGLAFTSDGRWLVSADEENRQAGTWVSGIRLAGASGRSPVQWKEPACGSYAPTAESKGTVPDGQGGVWDLSTGNLAHSLPYTRAPISIAGNSTVATARDEKPEVYLWGIGNGRAVKHFDESTAGQHISSLDRIRALALSHDGRWLASAAAAFEDPKIGIWDVATGRRVSVLTGHTKMITELVFNPESGILASGGWDDTVRLWDLNTAKETSSFKLPNEGVAGLAFSSDGKQLAAASGGGVILWDLKSPTSAKNLASHSYALRSLAFSNNGNMLFAGSGDGSIRVWDTRSGDQVATFMSLRGSADWLVVTPDGYFDGTPLAWKQLNWRFDNNTFHLAPVEAYFNDFFYPGLLRDILEGKRPPPPEGKELARRDRRRPSVTIAAVKPRNNSTAQENTSANDLRLVTIRVEVTENGDARATASQPRISGAQDVRLFRNGSLVTAWRGNAFDKRNGCAAVGSRITTNRVATRKAICTTTVPVVAGDNEFTAYAFNHDNLKSDDATPLVVKGDKRLSSRKGVLYVLAIGVNKYRSEGRELNFAVADVEEMGAALKAQQQKLSDYTQTEVVLLTDEQATKENIMLALRRFADGRRLTVPIDVASAVKQELEKIKDLQPEDALVVYYAGHGTVKGDHFYLLPHDFVPGNEDQRQARTVSDSELNEVLERVSAGKLLMVIDACQSGQALGGEKEGRGPMNSKGLAQLAYDKGMYILTAAQSYQAALEVSRSQTGTEIKHGLLTFALLEGLSKARKDSEGKISERDWMNYAVEQVPRMQLEEAKKRNAANEQGSDRSGKRVKQGQTPGGSVQRPRVFYRRELEMHPLIIAKR